MKVVIACVAVIMAFMLMGCTVVDEQGFCINAKNWNFSQNGLSTADLRIAKCPSQIPVTQVTNTSQPTNVSAPTEHSDGVQMVIQG